MNSEPEGIAAAGVPFCTPSCDALIGLEAASADGPATGGGRQAPEPAVAHVPIFVRSRVESIALAADSETYLQLLNASSPAMGSDRIAIAMDVARSRNSRNSRHIGDPYIMFVWAGGESLVAAYATSQRLEDADFGDIVINAVSDVVYDQSEVLASAISTLPNGAINKDVDVNGLRIEEATGRWGLFALEMVRSALGSAMGPDQAGFSSRDAAIAACKNPESHKGRERGAK